MSLTLRGPYDISVDIGMAVYLDGDEYKKADATGAAPLFQAVGLASSFSEEPGTGLEPVDVVNVRAEGTLFLNDWTNATGTPLLVRNKEYYLSETTPGMITLDRPVASGSKVVSIGVAKNDKYMGINVRYYGEIP